MSKQKSVRTFWPELAAALDGASSGVAEPGALPQPDCSIKGPYCGGKAAGMFSQSGRYSCIPCWGGRSGFVRNPAWTARRNPRKREEWGDR